MRAGRPISPRAGVTRAGRRAYAAALLTPPPMSVTDFERNDDLDGLTSAQLEARAFGPERRTLRGLLARRPAALPTPPPVAARPRRRGRVVAVAALAVGLAGVGAYALAYDVHHSHDGDRVHHDWVELDHGDYGWAEHDGAVHPMSDVYIDGEGVYERIEESATYRDALDEDAVDVFTDDGEVLDL